MPEDRLDFSELREGEENQYGPGQAARAESALREALRKAPGDVAALRKLGNLLREEQRLVEAEACYREALAFEADHLATLFDLAVALWRQGKLAEACNVLARLGELSPDTTRVWQNLGILCERQGDLAGAAKAFGEVARLQPDDGRVQEKLGDLARCRCRYARAESYYRRAQSLVPERIAVEEKLGHALFHQGKLTAAEECFQKTIAAAPDEPAGYGNLGNVRVAEGRLEEALTCFRQSAARAPADRAVGSNLLLCMNYSATRSPAEVAEAHRRWGRSVEEAVEPQPRTCAAPAQGRLRIGFVSPDFRHHVVMHFFEPYMECRDREQFEVFCYANVRFPDDVTLRLRSQADAWRPIWDKSDLASAEQVRRDRIDILVDLAGHMSGNRLGLFACSPAPVQMSWLGYPATTGLTRMDYRITDAWSDPPGRTEALHTEELLRIPAGFCVYGPPRAAPNTVPPPCLGGGVVTFGCFNNHAKLTDSVLLLWGRVLAAVPGSRLLLKSHSMADARTRRRTVARLAMGGVSPDRIELCPPTDSYGEHLASYGRVDVALDPFPYNGTTTTCEALWMGVPVVALAGEAHVSRVGVSLLTRAGLPELIALTPEDYVAVAAGLASSPKRLAELRTGMRDRLRRSALLDGAVFARSFEASVQDAWRGRCCADDRLT